MILQALTQLYYDLLAQGEISRPGWGITRVAFALCLDEEGAVQQIVPLTEKIQDGTKTKIVNPQMSLPAPIKRSANVSPQCLYDNSSYILGVDSKGNPQRSLDCFDECRKLHHILLDHLNCKTAKAILGFFDTWDPQNADANEEFIKVKDDIFKGGNIVFRVSGEYAHENTEIINAYQQYYDKVDGERIKCSVSGEEDVIELVHPAIKGVRDAQSSGAALVSYNADAYCSFGKKQGANAPIGKKAAFAYTTALNHLLADRDNVQHIGDTTVVCWAAGAKPQYLSLSLAALFGSAMPEGMNEDQLHTIVKTLANGLPCEDLSLYPETAFYILGLSPNAARLAVRFFYKSSFGELMKNVNDHHDRLDIAGKRFAFMPLWALLKEIVNPNSKDKTPSPVVAGSVSRAIVSGTMYPAGLIEATMLRIRAERKITAGRAAIIKAYYLLYRQLTDG